MIQELKKEILEKAVDGKLSCSSARNIAERIGLSYHDVGAAADELGIRIKNCELGCF